MSASSIASLRRQARDAFSKESYLKSNAFRVGLCFLAALIISGQHLKYRAAPTSLNQSKYLLTNATGLPPAAHNYSYGLYYWGLFPVYSTYEMAYRGQDKYSTQFAGTLLVDHVDKLHMEHGRSIRSGEYFKFYLPYLASLIMGKPGVHDLGLINTIFFVGAVFLIIGEFHRSKRTLLGCLVALLLSSSEFQAVQLGDDIFGYMITAAAFTLAFMAPFVLGRPMQKAEILIRLALCSISIVFCGGIRTTAMCMFLGPPLVLLWYEPFRFPRRIALLAVYVVAFGTIHKGTQVYFDHKINQATEFVQAVGGVPYQGERTIIHPIWRPVWCGLADFDTEYGHEWNDNKAWAAARDEMRERGWTKPTDRETHGDY